MSRNSAPPPQDLVGYTFVTRGRTISESDIIFHAGQTGDLYPLHLDAEEAKASPFGQRIAHGTLILSIAMGLKFDMSCTGRISYGYDRVRFVKPVFIGDTVRVRVTVVNSEIEERKLGYRRIVERMEVLNQQDKLVIAVDHILMRWEHEKAAADRR